jgi:hypothetical protein
MFAARPRFLGHSAWVSAAFPPGVVTFLFTDIEGSTRVREMKREWDAGQPPSPRTLRCWRAVASRHNSASMVSRSRIKQP